MGVGALSGNLALALDLTNKLLEIFPAHPRAVGNKEYYEDELQKGVTDKRKGDDGAAVADTDPVVYFLVAPPFTCGILVEQGRSLWARVLRATLPG
jgi:hypothetical protein